MKKLLAIIFAVVLCLGLLVACTPETPVDPNGGETTTTPGGEDNVTTPPAITDEGLAAAVEYLHQMYKDLPEKTGANYTLATKLVIGEDTFTITWTTGDERIAVTPVEGKDEVTIVIPDLEADTPYTLKAVVANAAGETATKEYAKIVPKFEYATFEQYAAAKVDEPLAITGIVSGIINTTKERSIFVQDLENKGGYYAYQIGDEIPEEIKIGVTVEVRGTRADYNGTWELKNCAIKVLDSTVKPVTPIDLTEEYNKAEDLKADALIGVQGALVTVKGVEIGALGDNGYHYFELAGKQSYIRISSSACPLSAEDQTAYTAKHTANLGNTADVTGIVSVYSGKFYLTPLTVDAISNVKEAERNDAQKIEFEIGNVTLVESVSKNTEIVLAAQGTKYDTVKFAWASDNACAVVEGGKLVITLPDAAASVKLTLTATCGEATSTKEFTIAVAAKPSQAPVIVDAPVAGTPYKFMLTQSGLGKDLYITGEMSGYYYATTEVAADAIDVYLEETTGGYYLYCMKGETKTYLNIIQNGSYINVVYDATATSVYTYDTTLKTLVTTVGENSYYFGTSGTYQTFSAKKTTNTNSYVAHFVKMADVGPNVVDTPTVGTAYKFMLEQEGINKLLYITGEMSGYYYATTENVLEALDVYIEETTGGYYLYCMKGETKTYLNIIQSGTHINVVYEATATSVYTYDATLKTLVTTVGETSYFFGTSGTYQTFSAQKTTSTNSYAAHFVTWVGPLPEEEEDDNNQGGGSSTPSTDTPVTEIAVGEAYYINSVMSEGELYFKGTCTNGRLDGTTNKAEAVAVYLEAGATAGQYYIYFNDGAAKKYIAMTGTSSTNRFSIVDTKDDATCLWTVDATAKTIISVSQNTRGFATQVASTHYNFSSYSTQNLTSSDYDWSWFVK